MMKENRLIIDPECSCLEIKGEVHAFLGDDSSHPRMKEINAVLEGFYERMREASVDAPVGCKLDEAESSTKAEIFCGHSERLAVACGLINAVPGTPIKVTKNLYMCQRCHTVMKFIAKIVRREISVQDTKLCHHFKDGICSCGAE